VKNHFLEKQAIELHAVGEVVGSVLLSVGQEAIPTGSDAALRLRDTVFATNRGYG
jgi:TPP-dependent pyruvate/acetoin dehydrogenase alpha subunit